MSNPIVAIPLKKKTFIAHAWLWYHKAHNFIDLFMHAILLVKNTINKFISLLFYFTIPYIFSVTSDQLVWRWATFGEIRPHFSQSVYSWVFHFLSLILMPFGVFLIYWWKCIMQHCVNMVCTVWFVYIYFLINWMNFELI